MSQQNMIAENPGMTGERLSVPGTMFRGQKESFEMSEQGLGELTEATHDKERYYPLYFTVMGFLIVTALVLSAANDFLFFGWLCLSAPIFLGLMAIHLAGIKQVKRK